MNDPLILGTTCHLCSLYGDRTHEAASRKEMFFHLLRHRDHGHTVSEAALDRYDPNPVQPKLDDAPSSRRRAIGWNTRANTLAGRAEGAK